MVTSEHAGRWRAIQRSARWDVVQTDAPVSARPRGDHAREAGRGGWRDERRPRRESAPREHEARPEPVAEESPQQARRARGRRGRRGGRERRSSGGAGSFGSGV
jgi:hypothetical protein